MILDDIRKQMSKINKLIKKEKDLRSEIGVRDMLGEEEDLGRMKGEFLLNRKEIKQEVKKLCDFADKIEEEKI